MLSVESNTLNSQRLKCYIQNLTKVFFCLFLLLGLQWEGMKDSIELFGANGMGGSLSPSLLNSQKMP